MTIKYSPEQILEQELLDSFLERTWDIGVRNERFHIRTLREVFSRVQNPRNWKAEIVSVIQAKDRLVVNEAIVFFTGSVPTFTACSHGRLLVRAAGYYEEIGA